MREIKFRAWSKENKEMFSHELLRNAGDGVSKLAKMIGQDVPGGLLLPLDDKDLSFMQYTGLKDKNGREIYEGDIIYWEIDNGVGIESYVAIVQWSENNEKYKGIYKWIVLYIEDYLRGQFDALSTPASYNYELQVMGNIYENPELLEVSE